MSNSPALWGCILLLGAGTFLMRYISSRLGHRLVLPAHWHQRLSDAATTLLLSVAMIATFYHDNHFAGFARTGGVAVALLLTLRRTPLIGVILSAAAVTALLRLAGIP